MSEIDFYKFLTENNIEYHWHDNEVFLFIPVYLIEEFYELIKDHANFDDDGISCVMKDGYFCFDTMASECDYMGLDATKIFDKRGGE